MRNDSVEFECDEEGCDGNASFHETKPSSFVPDGWSVTFELDDATKEDRPHYRCPKHN